MAEDAKTPESSTGENEEVKDREDVTEDEDTPDEELPFHKHPRWQKEHGYNRSVKEVIGEMTPAELSQELKRLREIDAVMAQEDELDEEPKPVIPKTDEEKLQLQKEEAAKAALKKLFPGLEKIDDHGRALDTTRISLARKAERAQKAVMKDAGMDPNSKADFTWLSRTLIEIINEDDELHDDYWTGNSAHAVKEAMKKLQSKTKSDRDREDRADKLRKKKVAISRLPQTHRPGTSEKPEPEKPQRTVKGALDKVLQRLQTEEEGD